LIGHPEAAIQSYMHVLKKDPWHSPPLAAAHVSHLALQHPWAAGAYLVAAAFQQDKEYLKAQQWYKQVLEHAPECALARHSLRAVSNWALASAHATEHHKEHPEVWGGGGAFNSSLQGGDEAAWPLEPTSTYVTAAFDGYARAYDISMSGLGYRGGDMILSALSAVLESAGTTNSLQSPAVLWDLGCGTGLVGGGLQAMQEEGRWPREWGDLRRWCIDLSSSSRSLLTL
jgi:predicted TPR repeat methyltransferase